MQNNSLFPGNTVCDPMYIGMLGFIISLDDLKFVFDDAFNQMTNPTSGEIVNLITAIKLLSMKTTAAKTLVTSLESKLKNLSTSLSAEKSGSDVYRGGYVHSMLNTAMIELLKTKDYIILSFQDIEIIINLTHRFLTAGNGTSDGFLKTIQNAVSTISTVASGTPMSADAISDRTNYYSIRHMIEQLRSNFYTIVIKNLLNAIIPCGVMSNRTLALNMDIVLKIPSTVDCFDNLSFHVIKLQNVSQIRYKSPYFGERMYVQPSNEVDTGFYYIVPVFYNHYLDQMNMRSIQDANAFIQSELAKRISDTIAANNSALAADPSAILEPIPTTYDVESTISNAKYAFSEIKNTAQLAQFLETVSGLKREYPIYTVHPNVHAYTYATCIDKHRERSHLDFTYDNYFTTNSLSLYAIALRLSSVSKKKVKIPSTKYTTTIPPPAVSTPFFNHPMSSKKTGSKKTVVATTTSIDSGNGAFL
jgi:hypothetical protein